MPLDLRMAPAVIQRIAERAGPQWLAIGTGLDAPDADGGRPRGTRTVEWLTARRRSTADAGRDDPDFPDDWEAQLDAWPRPTATTCSRSIYTSGTTGQPKGVMLTHGNILATLEACRAAAAAAPASRWSSLLPLSHLFEQAPVLFFGTMIGADILYVRSRNPRVIFEALREQRVTTMVVTPQLLELFWTAIDARDRPAGQARDVRARPTDRHAACPTPARRLLFRSLHRQLGGELTLFVSAGAYLPPELQQNWEDLGIVVLQGYGATECGPAAANTETDHPTGTIGRHAARRSSSASPTRTARSWSRGRPSRPATGRTRRRRPPPFDPDGWYHTGDIGPFRRAAATWSCRAASKNIIVLPNGLNVFPEDIETALQDHGLSQAVVLETAPGRIEAVVLPPGTQPIIAAPRPPPRRARRRGRACGVRDGDRADRESRRTSELGMHQRIDAWRLWPEPDFPRTHTLKIRRDAVREWAAGDAPLPVREERRRSPRTDRCSTWNSAGGCGPRTETRGRPRAGCARRWVAVLRRSPGHA